MCLHSRDAEICCHCSRLVKKHTLQLRAESVARTLGFTREALLSPRHRRLALQGSHPHPSTGWGRRTRAQVFTRAWCIAEIVESEVSQVPKRTLGEIGCLATATPLRSESTTRRLDDSTPGLRAERFEAAQGDQMPCHVVFAQTCDSTFDLFSSASVV